MAPETSRTHEALGRVRARLGALRPLRGLARRTLFRAALFAAFVAAVSFVGRAWALARVPAATPLVADRLEMREAPGPASQGILAAQASPTLVASAAHGLDRAPDAPPPEGLVNLNTATVSELESLPYVGPKRAQAILALRTKLGGRFKAVDDLLKVKGIGRGTLKRMRPKLTLGP